MNCKKCDKQFNRIGRQIYCSSKCRCLAWHKNNPERAREIRIKTKRKNKEKLRAYNRKYYALNKERMAKRLKEWRRNNPERTVQQVLKRRYKVLGLEGSHTLKEWQELKKKFNYSCALCGIKEPEIKLTRDHIKPVTKDGSNYITNIQPLCTPCNSRKFNHI